MDMMVPGCLYRVLLGCSISMEEHNLVSLCRLWLSPGDCVLLLEHTPVDVFSRCGKIKLLTKAGLVGYLDVWDWDRLEHLFSPVEVPGNQATE